MLDSAITSVHQEVGEADEFKVIGNHFTFALGN